MIIVENACGKLGAHISLSVHPSRFAVGLTATLARALADDSISCNTIAGFHHDHLRAPASPTRGHAPLTRLSEQNP